MARFFLVCGAIAGALSVMLGAFASHALEGRLLERSLEVFATGVRYQMHHALALVLVGTLLSLQPKSSVWLNISGISFIIGMIIFSGSLYLLGFLGIPWMGAITPIGGVAFIVGWSCLAIGALNVQLSPKL
ncbi:MAG: DUF423 domain-containing protein [Cyanobacteria bacterium P01_E01_bin.6]